MPWRKRRTHRAAISAWRIRCSATGRSSCVFAGSFVSHIELFWTMPEFKAFFDQLATFCRVVMFDKAGVGLSDPVPQVRTLDDRAAEIEAVMDAVGFGKAVLFGGSEGGPAAMVFAATRPERTRALILYGTFRIRWRRVGRHGPRPGRAAGAPPCPSWVRTTRRRRSSSPASRNSAAPSARGGAAVRHSGSAAVGPVDTPARHVGAHVREPGDGAGDTRSDVPDRRAADPADDHRANPGHPCPRRPRVPVQYGRYLADHIPGAR